jgi:cytochrome c
MSRRRVGFAWMLPAVLASVATGGAVARADGVGQALFEACRACHSLDPAADPMPGPNLARLIGRKVGGDANFDYSPVLRQAASEGQIWTLERLDAFLADPETIYPGLWMSMRGIADAADRKALARFLADPEAR